MSSASEMEELLIRSFQGRIDGAEHERLRAWRASSEENELRYRELSAVWRMTALPEVPVEAPPTAAAVLAAAERRRAGSVQTFWYRVVAAAALVAAVLVGGAFTFALTRGSQVGTGPYGEIVTGAGERATVNLWDGTAVRLGPQSKLRMEREGEAPVAWVEGLAFFGVQPDSTRNFTIRTPHGEVTALGTRFEVSTEGDELRVLVVEGTVRVTSAGVSLELGEGLMSRSAADAPPVVSRIEDAHRLLDWMGQMLVFRETQLARAIEEIEYRYGVEVELEDPALAELTVTATFTDQPVEHVILVMCQVLGAECVAGEGEFRIQGRPS